MSESGEVAAEIAIISSLTKGLVGGAGPSAACWLLVVVSYMKSGWSSLDHHGYLTVHAGNTVGVLAFP